MNFRLVATLGLAAAAAPAWSREESCQGSAAECPASATEHDSDASLLQVRGSAGEKASGIGCPNDFVWNILVAAAKEAAKQAIHDNFPLHVNHTFDHQNVSYGGCQSSVTGFASIDVSEVGLTLDTLTCNSAKCAASSWLGCTEYDPINMSVVTSATNLHLVANMNGTASWGASCPHGAGNATITNLRGSFTVENPTVSGTGAVDLIINPPNVTSPKISALAIGYDTIDNKECTMNGEPYDVCVDGMTYLNTDEFKTALAEAISRALDTLNQELAGLLKSAGLDLQQHLTEAQARAALATLQKKVA